MASKKTPEGEDRTAERAENEALTAKFLELRALVEKQDESHRKAQGESRGEVARLSQRVDQSLAKVDAAMTEWERKSRELDTKLREAGEVLLKTTATSREMKERVRVLDELREAAEDPRELLKPIRRDIVLLRNDLDANKKHTDDKIATLSLRAPRENGEHRGDPKIESFAADLSGRVRKLEAQIGELVDDS